MASLNDLLDDDFVDQPNNNPAAPEGNEVILVPVAGNSGVDTEIIPTNDQLFGAGAVPGQVPNLKTEIALLDERKKDLGDFVTKANNIQNVQKISQEDVKTLDTLQPGFIKNPIQFYTEFPSRSHLDLTMGSATTFVANQYTALDEDYTELLKKLVLVLNNAISESEVINEAIEAAHDNIMLFIDDKWQKVQDKSKRFYLTSAHKLSNLLDASIPNLDIDNYTTSLDLIEAFKNLQNIINQQTFCTIEITTNGKTDVNNTLDVLPFHDFSLELIIDFHKNQYVNSADIIIRELGVFKNSVNKTLSTKINEESITKDIFEAKYVNYDYFNDKIKSYENSVKRFLNFNMAFMKVMNLIYKKVS